MMRKAYEIPSEGDCRTLNPTLDIINKMETEGVIGPYAIAGAVAAYRYIEASVTEDLDILFSFSAAKPGLISLGPLTAYLKKLGYTDFRREGIMIEGWAVQFIPVADDLDKEALEQAVEVEIQSVRVRILRAEYLVAKALQLGRPKDQIRITQFLNEKAVGINALCDVIKRHGLTTAWKEFCRRTKVHDPCEKTTKTSTVRSKIVTKKTKGKRVKEDALLTKVLERKAEGRLHLAKLSISEKIERMERLRERLRPFKEARERRKAYYSLAFMMLSTRVVFAGSDGSPHRFSLVLHPFPRTRQDLDCGVSPESTSFPWSPGPWSGRGLPACGLRSRVKGLVGPPRACGAPTW